MFSQKEFYELFLSGRRSRWEQGVQLAARPSACMTGGATTKERQKEEAEGKQKPPNFVVSWASLIRKALGERRRRRRRKRNK